MIILNLVKKQISMRHNIQINLMRIKNNKTHTIPKELINLEKNHFYLNMNKMEIYKTKYSSAKNLIKA